MMRNDARFVVDATVAFAVYADTNGLTLEEGRNLAEETNDALIFAAEERAGYLPSERKQG
jgi:hypothetical protein